MNTCPNCGKMAGIHGSILQGCMCQYSMQAPPQRTWVGLTEKEIRDFVIYPMNPTSDLVRLVEMRLKEKNT